MKDLKLLLLIVFIAGLSNYLYSLWLAEEVYSFTIGFPLTIYYQLVIGQEPQFSYLPKNIIINVIVQGIRLFNSYECITVLLL